ncbi:hypothetical protein HELRODRAFT_78986, partial [Helobdella robusta]|uniref:BACK domain-containing protein n=1 Tax=Helobdella robusta TaxID=6412 RepID=T1G3H8_HELRO
VLRFVYTANGKLNSDNISQVISLLVKLGLNNLKDICKSYLVDCCNIENAVFHYSIALNNKMFEVAQILFNIIADNFLAVSNTTQFLYLSCERLLPFIKCTHLNVKTEMDVFMAVVNWINFDQANRLSSAKKLMADVHFEVWLFVFVNLKLIISNIYNI